jgi:hypothetical protein
VTIDALSMDVKTESKQKVFAPLITTCSEAKVCRSVLLTDVKRVSTQSIFVAHIISLSEKS